MTGPDSTSADRVVLDADDITRALTRIAHEIIESNHGTDGLLVLGIPTRGVPLAERLARTISEAAGRDVPHGVLDITMYRDDLRSHPTRKVGRTHVPVRIDGQVVVLVDDVLYSGRSVAAALDAVGDLGRPAAVRLAVLVDRGHRELPIRADFIGRQLNTDLGEHVTVRLDETDGCTEVTINGAAA